MTMHPSVPYTTYAPYSREQTGNIITFAQFEEGNLLSETKNLLSETRDDSESGNKYDDDSTMPPLISEEDMDAMSSADESNAGTMSTEIL